MPPTSTATVSTSTMLLQVLFWRGSRLCIWDLGAKSFPLLSELNQIFLENKKFKLKLKTVYRNKMIRFLSCWSPNVLISLCFLIVCLKIFPLPGVTLVKPKSLPCVDKIPIIIYIILHFFYIILHYFTLFYIILHYFALFYIIVTLMEPKSSPCVDKIPRSRPGERRLPMGILHYCLQ